MGSNSSKQTGGMLPSQQRRMSGRVPTPTKKVEENLLQKRQREEEEELLEMEKRAVVGLASMKHSLFEIKSAEDLKTFETIIDFVDKHKETIPEILDDSTLHPPILCDAGNLAMAKRLFGSERVKLALDHIRAAREFWETTSPTTQCNNVLKNSPKENCWLCGYHLFPAASGGENPKTTVCEHIFPVGQGVFFLELYHSKSPSTMSPERLKLEYDWAHAKCNSIKSNKNFIKEDMNPTTGRIKKWVVDETNILNMLNSISIEGPKQIFPEESNIKFDKNWKNDQFKIIKIRIQDILDTQINHGEDTAMMTYLLGIAKCIDPERLNKKVRHMLGGKKIHLKRTLKK
jgi:hypothetical protein